MPRVRFAYPGYGSRTNLPPHAREPARSCTHNRAADLLALSSAKSISRANTPPIHPVRRSHPEPSPPNTLPLGEGRSPRFVARIRPKAASGDDGAAWFPGDQRRARPRVRFAYPGYTSANDKPASPRVRWHYLRATGARMPLDVWVDVAVADADAGRAGPGCASRQRVA